MREFIISGETENGIPPRLESERGGNRNLRNMPSSGNFWTDKGCPEQQHCGGINNLASGRPSPHISANKDASFLHILAYRLSGWGNSDNGLFLFEVRDLGDGAVNPQRSARDSRKLLGKSRPAHRQSGRPSFWTLIEDKDAEIWDRLCDFRIISRNNGRAN